MSFYSTTSNIEQYIEMSKEYNGSEFMKELKRYLTEGSSVLELGMGEGKDQVILKQAGFTPTGSDSSLPFLERWNSANPSAQALFVNAVKMDVEISYDCIYSNKVLQHLTAKELKTSLENQEKKLIGGGILFHAIWYGEDSGDMGGSFYMSHTEQSLAPLIPESLELVELTRYTEMDENDSCWIVLQKRKK